VAAAPPPGQSSPLLKIVAVILGIIAFIVVIALGSCFYIGYRVQRKVKQIAGEIKAGPETSAVKTNYETRPLGQCEYKNRTGFDEYTSAAASASIPLKAGMTLTDIWPDPKKQQQDVEILHTVQGVHSSTMEISSMRLDGKSIAYSRNLCIADMINAHELETQFGPRVPTEMPGTTMFSLSRSEFDDLKAGRPTPVMYYDAYVGEGNTYKFSPESKGTFTRIEPDDVPYGIIVNGERKDLPTLHLKGDLKKYSYEAWVLDDASNPLILNIIRPNDKWHITYVKITFPVEKKIEQELAQNGRAEIYGIYFDFNSATLRPESDPVLKEISEALKHNPKWKIKIDGHTDNVGGDAYNQRLSERRAQSVLEALTQRYGITADRMTPEGFGASRPKATNDTVEGRALNRRVELVRE
jgi:outer membrane protein OmpA-like peptidoglycan-associated protein